MTPQTSLDAFLNAFNKYYLAFVPALLAYLLASPASLRVSIAVSTQVKVLTSTAISALAGYSGVAPP